MRSVAMTRTVLLFAALLSGPAFGAAKKSPSEKTFNSIVVVDGAMVYRTPSFDGEVIGYFGQATKVVLTKKRFGPFYRVRFKQGVWGYISDVDVRGPEDFEPKSGSLGETKQDNSNSFRGKFPFTSFAVGGGLAYLQYREILSRTSYTSGLLAYGLKFNAPLSFLGGPFFLDLTALSSAVAPDYYKTIASGPIQAQTSIVSLQMMYTLGSIANRTFWYHFGVGPAFIYGRYAFDSPNGRIDAEESRLGASFTLGLSYMWKAILLKLEPSFVVERTQFPMVMFSTQYAF